MNTLTKAGLILAVVSTFPIYANAKVPCEETLKDVRATRSAAKLADADATKIDALIQKGIDRCNADDDDRANGFFKDAMTAMGK